MHPNQHTYVVFLTHDTFWRNIHIVLFFFLLAFMRSSFSSAVSMNWELTTQKICLILMAGQRTLTMKLWVSYFTSSPKLWVKPSTHECVCLNLPAKAQKVEMDKLEKAKKERTKVSPTTKNKVDYTAVSFVLCLHQGQVSTSCWSFLLHVLHQTRRNQHCQVQLL